MEDKKYVQLFEGITNPFILKIHGREFFAIDIDIEYAIVHHSSSKDSTVIFKKFAQMDKEEIHLMIGEAIKNRDYYEGTK